jgi:hypothetical protein
MISELLLKVTIPASLFVELKTLPLTVKSISPTVNTPKLQSIKVERDEALLPSIFKVLM